MKATAKQREVLNALRRDCPRITVCHGAKRSGKTFVVTFAFLAHILRFENSGSSFILGGASLGSLRRNVLDDMENILGHPLKTLGRNCFEVFGCRLYCFEGANSGSWKKIRGFTAAGAFLNEATALEEVFVREAISRCSQPGARIFMDTNPEGPGHFIKRGFIELDGQRLPDGSVNIRAFGFSLFDNTALDPAYVDSVTAATPAGMFYDRDILGRWVSAEGVVYRDYSDRLLISRRRAEELEYAYFYAGVDWGYEHYGAIVLIGETEDGTAVLLEECARRLWEIDLWVEQALSLKERYGDIPFYCDSARPEHIKRFRREGLRAKNANKAVLSGIEEVARLMKGGRLLICEDARRFREEVELYVWDETTGLPKKRSDDVLDALRYAVYSRASGRGEGKVLDRRDIF